MRIHRLSLNAFGPFPGTEQVDLDRLGRDGLFLLTGPTGAGKSTLFEAICFALYGSTTAEGSQGLKSHFAAAESEPWVEMDFTVGVYRYRIRRTPVWSKPSKRAKSGRVTRQASVSLARCPEEQAISREAGAEASRQRDGVHDDSWEMVATRLDEAGRCITELLGLSRSQFAQVVMLPQGRFAQFLAAESKDREALLSTLFPTELYARVQAQLKAEAREAGTLVERSVQRSSWLEEQLEVFLRELADLAETDRAETELSDAVPEHQSPGETMREDAASAGLIERWEEAGGRVRQQHEEVERRREDSLRRLEGHRERLAHLEDAAKQWQEHRELERRRDDLRQRQAEADQRSAALTASRRAEPAARAVHARREADDLLAQRRSQTQQISDELETLPTPAMIAEGLEIDSPPRWLASPDSDQAASGQMRAETSVDALSAGSSGDPDPVRALESVLEAAVKQRHQHDQSAAELDTLRTEHKRLQRRAEEAVSAYVRLAEQRDQLEKDRKIQQEQAGELPALRAAEREAQQHWEAAHRLQSARDQEAERQRGFEQAEERRRKASAQVDQLHRARQEDARAALSQELMPEQPCPVCGSTEHPEPYDPAQASETDDSSDHAEAADQQKNMPISEQLEAVTRERAVAEQRAQRAFEVLSEVRAQIAVLVAALEDDDLSADPERARDLLERAAARRKRAEEAEQRVEALAQQLRQIEEQLTTAESSRAQAHEESVRISGRLREAEERLEKMSVALESLPHREELSHRLQHLQRIRRTLEQLRLAQDRQEQAESTARQRSQQLAQALREGEWNSAEQALDTYLGTEEQDRLGQEVRQDELQRARFDEAWDAAEHQELLRRQDQGETAPTTDQLQQARAQLAAAEQAHEQVIGLLAALEGLLRRAQESIRQAQQLGTQYEDQLQTWRMLKELSETAEGSGSENDLRMSLTTYVLAAQLEQIAEAASLRLSEMTAGRYSLHHSDARASRGARSGLGLEVYDSWSSHARPTSSLSGGETFMAALCLALGLADVVQAQSGGIIIDTLFVDEGFGTLDESTLEDVMDALDGLRAHGRVVGLISHVTELRSRIPQRVRIHRAPEGSTLSMESA